MGNPVFDPIGKGSEATTSPNCLAGRQVGRAVTHIRRLERNPFRRPPVYPSLEELEGGDAGWSGWTRNIRQRAEIFHTDAPNMESGAADRGERRRQRDSQAETGALTSGKDTDAMASSHWYTLRLGYDPRVFLEDPALRGQQLTAEAAAWAAAYRSRIPMVTDLQLARRLEPETGQYTQTEIGEGPRAGPTQAAAAPLRSRVGSSSDDEDAGEVTEAVDQRARGRRLNRPPDDPPLHLLQQLATQDSPFSTASPQDRLSMLGEAISAASWEMRNVAVQAGHTDAERPGNVIMTAGLTDRPQAGNREAAHAVYRTTQGLSERLLELDRLLGEGSPNHRRITEYLQRQSGTAARTRPFESS